MKTDNVGAITIPVKVDLDDAYWQHCRAELVRELAIKSADLSADRAALIVKFATRIVEGLRQQ